MHRGAKSYFLGPAFSLPEFQSLKLALPGTEASGLATVDLVEGSAPELTLDFVATRLDLADLQWLLPSLPNAKGLHSITA